MRFLPYEHAVRFHGITSWGTPLFGGGVSRQSERTTGPPAYRPGVVVTGPGRLDDWRGFGWDRRRAGPQPRPSFCSRLAQSRPL